LYVGLENGGSIPLVGFRICAITGINICNFKNTFLLVAKNRRRNVRMVFFEKFVANLKVDGRFLRNDGNNIRLPFGSTYILFLKNMESRDAVVKISIDGADILSGNSIIIQGNSSLELEGFLEGNIVRNKFKFIEMTKEIEDYRGIRAEDSLIRIEFRFQKKKEVYPQYVYTDWKPWYYYQTHLNEPNPWITWTTSNSSGTISTGTIKGIASASCFTANMSSENDLGITVRGETTHQGFEYGSIGELEEQSHVLILKLSGYKIDNSKVETVVTVKDKIECKTCGLKNSSENRFCGRCGTYL
jgi:hypothetical protein